jgi:hypothetical protein
MQVDGGRPSLVRVEELLPCTISKVPDGFLCNAILEVGIDPTEGESLSLCTAAVFDGIVCKSSIVAVVVEDLDAVLLSKVFEGSLASIVSSEVSLVIRSAKQDDNLGHQISSCHILVVSSFFIL